VAVFPNPTTGIITVRVSAVSTEPIRWRIFDLTGKEVYAISTTGNEPQYGFDLSSLQDGMYFLEMRSGTEIVRKKISIDKD
jgi:hypothetical protein